MLIAALFTIAWTQKQPKCSSTDEWIKKMWHIYIHIYIAFPGGASGKEPACQCRRRKRHGFDLWVWKIPRRRTRQLTPVFLPGESHIQRRWQATVHRVAWSQTWLKWCTIHTRTCTHTHTHTMEYYSAVKKGEIMPFVATWTDIEIIILSKPEKDKYIS